jgi:hypothetical protein
VQIGGGAKVLKKNWRKGFRGAAEEVMRKKSHQKNHCGTKI